MTKVLLTLSLVFLVACGGVKRRINDNEDLFASYPPDVQAMIKSEQIAQGFDQTQTYMALGKPEKKEFEGNREIWLYTVREKRTLKHEKGAVQYENEQLKYEKAMDEYRLAIAEGRYAVEPKKPDPFYYEHQSRTRVRREVVFENGRVAKWQDPHGMYLDDWH